MSNKSDNQTSFSVREICNQPELIDENTLCRLHRHGLALWVNKSSTTRYIDVVKKNEQRVRPRSEINSVFVGFDTPFVERGKIKNDTDVARVSNYFRLNNIDKDSVIWFAIGMTENINHLVDFKVVMHADPKRIDHYSLIKSRPQFFYVKRIDIENWLGVKKLNKNHVKKITDLLQWELDELSKHLNAQSYYGEVQAASNEKSSQLNSLINRGVCLKEGDAPKNSLTVNKVIDELLAFIDKEASHTVKIEIGAARHDISIGKGVEVFLALLKSYHAVTPTIGGIEFDETSKRYRFNIDTRSLPPFISLYNKNGKSLYRSMQLYLEKAIAKDPSLETCRWAFSETMFVSDNYDDWSAILLTALFETLISMDLNLKVFSVEKAKIN